jgi:hypothetical protein
MSRGTERSQQPWEPPTLKVVGAVADVLKGGGGKDSPSPADPGEVRKPKPSEDP